MNDKKFEYCIIDLAYNQIKFWNNGHEEYPDFDSCIVMRDVTVNRFEDKLYISGMQNMMYHTNERCLLSEHKHHEKVNQKYVKTNIFGKKYLEGKFHVMGAVKTKHILNANDFVISEFEIID